MSQSVVLVEEESARIVVATLAEKLEISPPPILIPHQGKHDLERSIRNKLARWRSPEDTRFVVLCDNDRSNCATRKAALLAQVPPNALPRTRIRLALQELESWYFGDLQALVGAGLLDADVANRMPKQKTYRDPDGMLTPKRTFRSILLQRQEAHQGQILLARRIAPHLSITDNRSVSFRHFVNALKWSAGG